VQAKEEDVVIVSMEESCKKIVKELDTLFKYQEGAGLFFFTYDTAFAPPREKTATCAAIRRRGGSSPH